MNKKHLALVELAVEELTSVLDMEPDFFHTHRKQLKKLAQKLVAATMLFEYGIQHTQLYNWSLKYMGRHTIPHKCYPLSWEKKKPCS